MAKARLPGQISGEVIDMDFMAEYKHWLESGALSAEEHAELQSVADDKEEIESRFYAPLSFGTAGLRGVLGVGLNRMNRFTVGQAAQGLAKLIVSNGQEAMDRGVAIAYDSRHFSPEFAKQSACILAANGIKALIFDELRPTPELSFAVRHYGCIAGINITASHNPKEYNGYKVYWEDGAQLPPAEADVVAKEMAATDIFTGVKTTDFDEAVKSGMIRILDKQTDEAYLSEVIKVAVNPDCVKQVADDFKLVYTPFHGAGYRLVPEILRRLGYKHIICEPEQMKIDGDFPTVKNPNPEYKEGFYLAIDLAKKNDVDLIIGTDPDADRTGIVLKDKSGEYVTLSGNQVGVLLTDYIITAKKLTNTMPAHPAVLKSIVTTEMARAAAEKNGVACFDTFTGFKFLAEKIKQFEKDGSHEYIFAFEESYGYLCGDYARDKDAAHRLHADRGDGGLLPHAGQDAVRRNGRDVRKVRLLLRTDHFHRHAGRFRSPAHEGAHAGAARQAADRCRPGQGRLHPRLHAGHPYLHGRRQSRADGAQGSERHVLRARGRHDLYHPSVRHRAQGQGIYHGQGREQGRG